MANKFDHSLAAKGQRAVAQILQDHIEHGHVKISLAQFRDEFLPRLADPTNHDINYWVQYVKQPGAWLFVMEPDDVTVKYRVPPLIGSLNTTVPAVGRPALDIKMNMAHKRIERSPRSAEKEMQEALAPHINIPKGIINNRIRLNHILVQEGYPPLPIPGAPEGFTGLGTLPESSSSTSTPAKVKYEDEYDEL